MSPRAIRILFSSLVILNLLPDALCVVASLPAVNLTTNTADREALLCIKSHLSMPNTTGAMATWSNGSMDFCRWQGVWCGRRHGTTPRVTALDLEGEGLVGQIPPCIANLTYLERIHLPDNQLIGLMPRELCQLGELKYVNFSFNSLGGAILSEISSCSPLQVLALRKNKFDGGIPASLFNSSFIEVIDIRTNNLSGSIPHFLPNTSTSLEYLGLSGNCLSGVIPSSISNLLSLAALRASENQLNGVIPDSLGSLSNMQLLDLTYNNLSGTVPNSIYNLSFLTYLGLGNNSLVGKLPSTIGNTLPNIEELIMSACNFEGEIPKSLANATNLAFLFLAENSFNGVIPSLGSLPNLQKIMLFQNRRLQAGDWTFLVSLTNCTQLVRLGLNGNNLQGDLPSSVANLSGNLQRLLLGSNQITGTIPSGIGDLIGLSMLYLENNFLTGPIPASIGKLRSLFALNLSKNRLYGKIPISLGNLNQLSELYLQENNLGGKIPTQLSGCKNLLALNLSSNAFSGAIQEGLFGKLNQLNWLLDLSNNQLTSSIPDEIGKLINLASLNISNNKISGQIPSTLGSCVFLQELNLEGNFLEGEISASLASLKGIKEMDFSRNNLSGKIPEFFELFNSLQYLNLSYNNLYGPIPTKGIFENATNRIYLDGNPRLCTTSPLLLQFQLCSFKPSDRSYRHLVQLLAIILPCITISVLFVLLIWKITSKSFRDDNHDSSIEFNKLSYNDLSKATDGFASVNLIGSGQFGVVYKGKLSDEVDELIAIKVFKLDQFGAADSFLAECSALRNTRHRNLVKVITACSTYDPLGNEFKALILEYMANGTLENRLHNKFHQHGYLNLGLRISAAVDIASVLDYLHNCSAPTLIHCDLKPSNILFDDSNVAHVGDFGIARFLHGLSSSGIHQNSTSLAGPRGSVGYIAPEYGMGGKISPEGDVYSYGIVLLEMLTGKRPTDELFKDGLTLHKYVMEGTPRVLEILDPGLTLEVEGNHCSGIQAEQQRDNPETRSCILQLLNIGLSCSAELPKDRPSMQDICSEVVAVKERFLSGTR